MTEKELIGKVHSAVYHQCQRRGYATPVDVLMEVGVLLLSRKLNDALSSRLFYAHFDSHRDISHFKSSCFGELFS